MKLPDGFACLITLGTSGAIKLYEKEVQPPGLDAGGGIDITTMRNARYRTKAPKKLITGTDSSIKAGYDPDVIPQIIAAMGVNQLITWTFPDTCTFACYAFLDKFAFTSLVEGGFPLADVTIVPTFTHPTTGAETAPVETAASGSHS